MRDIKLKHGLQLAEKRVRMHHAPMVEQNRKCSLSNCVFATHGRFFMAAFAGVLFSVLLVAVPAPAGEGIDCNCVANGERIELGKLHCIKTASGKEFLARCERVLNNTSWKRLQEGCPSAGNRPPAPDNPLI